MALPANPRRIVSLAPNVTDALFALGFGGRVVGVTDFCKPPGDSRGIARVGGMSNPSLETLRALSPDLLIASSSGNEPALSSQAAALGLPLYTVHTPDVEGTLRAMVDLAAALGDRPRGERLVAGLRARLDDVERRVGGFRPARVLFLVWGDPLVVPGRSAYLTDALGRSGGLSVTRDAPGAWPAFDLESAVVRAPEVILTVPPNAAMVERLRRDPAWMSVPAVRNGRIHVVSEAIEEPGPRVVQGIEEVARLLHPGAFESQKPAAAGRKGGEPCGPGGTRTAGGSRR